MTFGNFFGQREPTAEERVGWGGGSHKQACDTGYESSEEATEVAITMLANLLQIHISTMHP